MDYNQLLIGVTTAIVGGVVPYYLKRISDKIDAREQERVREEAERIKELQLLHEAIKAVIRDRLLQARRYFCGRGFIPAQEYENISALYNAYEKMGGNDLGHKAYMEISALPFEPPAGES